MIKIDQVKKTFNRGKKIVLDNISFQINDGESVAILGGNGAGKTTLLEIIAGVLTPEDGRVYFVDSENDSKINKNLSELEEVNIKNKQSNKKLKNKEWLLKEDLEKNVGFQFQNGKWPFNTRGIDLLNFFGTKNWKSNEYINMLIDVFEVNEIIKKRLNKCSGGEQQRFNCLLSIINKPKILILDELITGLDLKMQIKLINFFKELKKSENITLIIVSHVPEEVEALSERIILLREGRIYLDDSVDNIKSKYKSVRELLTQFYASESENYEK
ncbi:ABC transporter ATP-binding protein [Spiroplasma endosymbiont of Aspidapion aeneum]|uniref:ABC transporter ATP-binding protein n=1 Tax=Spiroplasma endosymbiont of Aspidapion aeneum TaxID=3066276 RepID=UPI00313AE247